MKKKILSVLLCVSMMAALAAGCGKKEEPAAESNGTQEPAQEEQQEALEAEPEAAQAPEGEKKTFTVGFDAEFPPYGYKDENGEYVGFDLSLAQEVCDRLGWELVKQPIDWNSKDMELSSGAIDCIWNGFTMNGREDQYTFSDPYIDNSQVFVVAADSGIASWDDLAGKEVLVQADSSALHALTVSAEDTDDAELVAQMESLVSSFGNMTEVPDYNSAFNNLEAGAADAIAMDIGVARYQIAQRGEGAFVILEQEIAAEQYAVGFLKGNTELKDQVQATLYEMVEDGTFEKIAKDSQGRWDVSESVCLGK
ncbi:MAG: amino acid ABC transporter substrate-binding protein [Lachnospiraceae bacterium]|nr:amino acid ABC transporter substrate-binding protein [Lachnospiraceae bacterium]MCI8994743.1 amino acid ABC transporter substrate-binding protein [Lachnospiraceae bacterium]MCI9133666.1 amino acid ABC transporter substrate-binding protein [Lachnospiraceae bacterium]